MTEDILVTLQLDARQAIRLGSFIKSIQKERDALAAQVEAFKNVPRYIESTKSVNDGYEHWEVPCLVVDCKHGKIIKAEDFDKLITQKPQHHLDAHDAEVAVNAVSQYKTELLSATKVIFHPHIEGVFAVVENQLRAKAGE